MIDHPEGMPCWAPGAAERLAELLTGKEMAWEWGGGASTIWLADKVRRLDVIEHDPRWVKWIKDRLDSTVSRRVHAIDVHEIHWEKPNYTKVVRFDKPMLWLIDGYRRIDCMAVVEKNARGGDIVVLDDALDYAEHLLDGDWEIMRFEMPHPHAGIPINHKKYGAYRNTVRKVHADTKETWVIRV